ncbi:MAG: WbqC family protein [Candidatus Eisenbacteria sp.]|nr:WbqC family protein [Candidatus Eisenbacteria bacterium]
MRAAIVQSSYIPWKGYFSLIQLVDDFILYDDVQYTHRDWRNRNRIKTRQGPKWLSIPVAVKGRFTQRVRDAEISDPRWARKHWNTICANYARAPFFDEIAARLEPLFEQCGRERGLSAINSRLTRGLAAMLGITTRIHDSAGFELHGNRTERLVHLCRQLGATDYLTGPRAADYLDERCFLEAGMRVCWMDYSGYPEYPQLFSPPFIHEISVIDLLMNQGCTGAEAYMAAFRDRVGERIFASAQAESHAEGAANGSRI